MLLYARRAIKAALRSAGYELRAIRQRTDGAIPHEDIKPLATYAPWRGDRDFLDVYGQIHGSTLVDIYRCYELWQLVAETAKTGEGAFLEVGVWRGGTSAIIARRAKLLGIKEPLFACDTFRGVVKAAWTITTKAASTRTPAWIR
jgi:O-methyltransferase